VSATLLIDEKTKGVNAVLGVERVIEDRKRLENTIQESEEKYRYITENSANMI